MMDDGLFFFVHICCTIVMTITLGSCRLSRALWALGFGIIFDEHVTWFALALWMGMAAYIGRGRMGGLHELKLNMALAANFLLSNDVRSASGHERKGEMGRTRNKILFCV
jgi:hypothetical protein